MKLLEFLFVAVSFVACVAVPGIAFSQTPLWAHASPAIPFTPAVATKRQKTRNETLVSPLVASDGRVTFRVYAPEAKSVTLRGNSDFFRTPPEFVKDEQGIWSATTDPATD
jgi:hypothetical protein